MLPSLLLAITMSLTAPHAGQTVQSRNGEFIFSQYPPRALAAGEQGAVRFRAEVDADGTVLRCKIVEGSGHKRLDRETCDLIVDHATFKPVLDGEGKAREATHEGIVNWRIPGAAPAAKTELVEGRPPDEVICKRVTKTGSLVSRSRLCMTRREWIESAERNQTEWGDLQGRRGFTESNCTIDPDPSQTGVLAC